MTDDQGIAQLSPHQLEQLWADHLKGEFETRDVEATLATMVDDAYVNHMPVNTGESRRRRGTVGRRAARRFHAQPADAVVFAERASDPQANLGEFRRLRPISWRQARLRTDLLGSRWRVAPSWAIKRQ